MILAEHISKRYGPLTAVDDVSFEVQEGENLVLLGTSGCGKTTTLKMLNRLTEPDAGIVKIGGKDVKAQPPEVLRRGIGYVLQHNSLFPHYTVAKNIAVVPRLLGWSRQRIAERSVELLVKLRLPESYLYAYPHELSGGQQQRVNIARALAADPPILLMDEPFGALDTVTRAGITREFLEISEFINKTIVLVTHDVQEAFLLGNRICLMNEGKIVQIGKPAELLFRPASPFVKEFLSSSYLSLALSLVKVADIWGNLAAAESAVTPELVFLPGDSAAFVLEQMMKHDMVDVVQVKNTAGQVKLVNRHDLFKAINNYKY